MNKSLREKANESKKLQLWKSFSHLIVVVFRTHNCGGPKWHLHRTDNKQLQKQKQKMFQSKATKERKINKCRVKQQQKQQDMLTVNLLSLNVKAAFQFN